MTIFYQIRLSAQLVERYDDFSANWDGEKFSERSDPFSTNNKTQALSEFDKAVASLEHGNYMDSYKIELKEIDFNEEEDQSTYTTIKTVYGKLYRK